MAAYLSRRTFLKATTAATAGSYAARVLPAWAAEGRGEVAVTPPLSTFPYSDVEQLNPRKPVSMRPFMSIDKESYSTYVQLKS